MSERPQVMENMQKENAFGQTTTTQVQGMTWKCPKCPAWPYLNRKKCLACGAVRPADVKRKVA